MTSEIVVLNGSDWLDQVKDLSALSPEVALNLPLGELVQTTLTAAAGDSVHTARAYQSGIGLFLMFLSLELGDKLPVEWQPLAKPTKEGRRTVWEIRGHTAVLRTVSAGTLDRYQAWLAEDGVSKSTQQQRRGAAATFLSVAYRDGVMTNDQAVNMGLKPYKKRQRRDEKPVGRRLKPPEVRKLREIVKLTAKTDIKAVRDLALIDCMLYAGLRREEVATLRTSSFNQDGGRWWIVLQGKGRKTRRLKMHDALYKSINEWLVYVDLTIGEGDTPIFRNLAKGGKLTDKAFNASVIGRLVTEYGAAAGLAPASGENCLSPHDLRRTCARNAYENGATLLHVQTLLGHADPKTTVKYIGALENDDDTAIDYVRY